MQPLLAAAPIVVILVLMLGPRWSAARAGAVGAVTAVAIGVMVFAFPRVPGVGLGEGLTGTTAEAAFTALTILWIIGPALGIHELQLRTGAADVLRSTLAGFAPDPRILALLVAWFFVLSWRGLRVSGASVAPGGRPSSPLPASGRWMPWTIHPHRPCGGRVLRGGVGGGGTAPDPALRWPTTGARGLELARATGIYHSLLGWLPLRWMIGLVQAEERRGWERRHPLRRHLDGGCLPLLHRSLHPPVGLRRA